MKIRSDAFEDNGEIPSKYTCDDKNLSPPLEFIDVPENAKSIVLVMDDPDALRSAGKVWDHWIVFNIPPNTSKIDEGTEPQGISGINSFGNFGYSGPCPPDAKHKYFFKLFALDNTLDLNEGATKKDVEKFMQGHIIESAKLVGRYQRGQQLAIMS